MNEQPWLIIGVIDAYGAIHHQAIYHSRPNQSQCHEHYWPECHHKRWRFILSDWDLSKSALSKEYLTADDARNIESYIRKRYTPPLWYLKSEEWESMGRPRSGKSYEKHEKKWDRIMRMHKNKA